MVSHSTPARGAESLLRAEVLWTATEARRRGSLKAISSLTRTHGDLHTSHSQNTRDRSGSLAAHRQRVRPESCQRRAIESAEAQSARNLLVA